MTADLRFRFWSRALVLAAATLAAAPLRAQSSCSSDGQPQPVALLERFISADCEPCWASGGPWPHPGEVALDWIVPGSRGDDAPLSAAARRDGLARLEALRRTAPESDAAVRRRVILPKRGLRVSHGLPFNDYVGASIELKQASPGRWTAWLLLVETIPAGVEGTPIERNLVRNALKVEWADAGPLPKAKTQRRLFESRSMAIAQGAQPARLRVVGWMEDGRGRIRAIAQSQCTPSGPGG